MAARGNVSTLHLKDSQVAERQIKHDRFALNQPLQAMDGRNRASGTIYGVLM